MKRSLFAALLGTLTAFVLPPMSAAAQDSASVSISGASSGAVLEGTVTIKAQGSATTGVERLELSIDGFVVAWTRPEDLRQSATVQYHWNTARSLSSQQPSRNGQHTIKAVVHANAGGTDRRSIEVLTNNPASAPGGLSAASSAGAISLDWDPNPEPDILVYRVERDAGAGFEQVGQTQRTSFSERRSPGSYDYRIVAVRSSATHSGGIVSPPSEPVGIAIVAPEPDRKARSGGGGGRSSGRGGSSRGTSSRGGVSVGGKRIAQFGLPSGPSLPGRAGLPALPETQAPEWGSYKKRLPYDIADPEPSVVTGAPANIAARSPDRIIPPDGLRWVAAGVLLLATASLLAFFASRLKRPDAAETS